MTRTYYSVLLRTGRVVDVQRSWPAAAKARLHWLELRRFAPVDFVVVRGYRSLAEAWAARWDDAIGKLGRVA
jgi:hypothetical protein